MNAKLIDRLRSRVINSTGEIDREAQKIFTPGQVYVTPSHNPPPPHQHPNPILEMDYILKKLSLFCSLSLTWPMKS